MKFIMDNMTKEQQLKNIQAISSKDKGIEIKLRKALYKRKIRYRKNYSAIHDKPDIAITKHKIVIFCDSEFCHRFNWEQNKIR